MAKPTGPNEGGVHPRDPVNPRPGMNRAWEQVAMMTVGGAVEACFTVSGIEYVEVAKIKPGFSGGLKVGELRPGDPNPEDIESYILQNWGPGVYALSPVYRSHKLRTRSFPIGGEAAFEASIKGLGAGADSSGLDDVDRQIANSLKRESATQALERIKRIEKGDDMTPEQLTTILDRVLAGRAAFASPDPMVAMMEKQMLFIERQLDRERERADRLMTAMEGKAAAPVTDPTTLLGLGAAFLPLIGKMPAKSLGVILNGVMRFLKPQEPTPETGWTPEQVMTTLQMAGPLLQGVLGPVLETIRQALVPGGGAPAAVSPVPTMVAAPPMPLAAPAATSHPSPGGGIMPIELNAEEKLSMDLYFQFLAQEDYESCWSTLGTTEKTIYLNMAVMDLTPAQKPESLLPLFLRFDPRTSGMIGDISKYLAWAKQIKKPAVEAQEAEDEAAEATERRDGREPDGSGERI